MLLRLAIPLLLLTCVLAGCGASQGGIWPAPVRNLEFGAITVPAGPLTHGESAEFSVTWSNGRSPYTIEWYFAEGADSELLAGSATALTHTAHITAVNETTEPIVFTGQVTITDMDESEVASAFTYTVNPAL